MFKNKEYVLAVQKYKSFSSAAKQLYISQPSLSSSVKRIETEIGAPIFDRSSNPLSLTEIGEKYLKCATEISAIEESFKSYVRETRGIMTGEIKIGGTTLFSSFVLPPFISEFNKRYPRVDFTIIEDNTHFLIDMLLKGEIDMVVDNAVINSKSVVAHSLLTEMILLAVPERFEINKKFEKYSLTGEDIKAGKHKSEDTKGVPLEAFKDEPFILLKSENDTGKRARRMFKRYDISPKIVFKLDQLMTSYNITCLGMGISFINDTLINNMNSDNGLRYYKIDDPETTRDIYFYVKANHYLSNACKEFIDLALK